MMPAGRQSNRLLSATQSTPQVPRHPLVEPDSRDARIAQLEQELCEARGEIAQWRANHACAMKQANHWHANHDDQVRRKRRAAEIKDEIIAEQQREIGTLREQLKKPR